jgi:hypothetical protein
LEVAVTVEQQVTPELPVVVAQVLRSALLLRLAVVVARGNKALLRESLAVLVVVGLLEVVVGPAIPRLYHHPKVTMAVLALGFPLISVVLAVAEHRLQV